MRTHTFSHDSRIDTHTRPKFIGVFANMFEEPFFIALPNAFDDISKFEKFIALRRPALLPFCGGPTMFGRSICFSFAVRLNPPWLLSRSLNNQCSCDTHFTNMMMTVCEQPYDVYAPYAQCSILKHRTHTCTHVICNIHCVSNV